MQAVLSRRLSRRIRTLARRPRTRHAACGSHDQRRSEPLHHRITAPSESSTSCSPSSPSPSAPCSRSLMRIHLVWPDLALPFFGVIKPEDYLALVTMHGTLMVFFVLTIAPQSGFANLVLPEQIGARSMAFPRLNAVAFWLTTRRPPRPARRLLRSRRRAHLRLDQLSARSAPSPPPAPARRTGMDLWLVSHRPLLPRCHGSPPSTCSPPSSANAAPA